MNGIRLDLASEELLNWDRLHKAMFEQLDELPASNRQIELAWKRTLAGLMGMIIIHDAPPEASDSGQVLAVLEDWVEECSEQVTALFRGDPYWADDHVYISLLGYEQLLATKRLDKLFKTSQLVSFLKSGGWKDATLFRENKKHRLWAKSHPRPEGSVADRVNLVVPLDEV